LEFHKEGMISMSRRVAFLAPAAVLLLLLSLIGASTATATHPHPQALGALQQTSSLVPAMQQCGGGGPGVPNRGHDGPIQLASCGGTAMKQLSTRLKIGPSSKTTNSTLPPPGNRGALIQVINPQTASEDVKVQATSTDVRCIGGVGALGGHCVNTGGATFQDYTGDVLGFANIRITDTCNSTASTGACGTVHATVQDIPFSIGIVCNSTAAVATGGTCAVSTTVNTVVPNGPAGCAGAVCGGPAVKNGKQASVQIDGLKINDAGDDGLLTVQNPFSTQLCSSRQPGGNLGLACIANPTDTLLAVQGIYIP